MLKFIVIICFYVVNAVVPFAGAEDGTAGVLMIPAAHSRLIRTQYPIIRASVANPKIADVSVVTPNQVLVIARSQTDAATTLILWQDENTARSFDIRVYTQVSPLVMQLLRKRIKKIAPSVNIRVMQALDHPENGTVILTGEVASQRLLNRVILLLKSFRLKYYNLVQVTGSQQVQLKVVIAEISRSGLKQMGINFLDRGLGIFKGGQSEGKYEFELTDKTAALLNTRTLKGSASIVSPFASAFQVAVNSSADRWIGILSLLKNQGLAKSLATPTLVTMNGQSASFQVGGEYPVPIQGDKGQITIEQISYGIILSFTPYIIDDETISLEVSPEVSTPDFSLGVTAGGVTVPGLTTRKGQTTLELKSGQTFAMAGLLQEEAYSTTNKIPFLGDLPFIGTFFTNKETKHKETELVIMVTPEIVRPLNKDEVPALPGQNLGNKISDMDFFIANKTHLPAEPGRSAGMSGSIMKFRGKTGFSR